MIILEEKIRQMADYYVRKYKTSSPFILADALNIKVVFMPLGKIAGFYKYIERNRWIFINSSIEDNALTEVIAAHELGHALLHPKENCCFMAQHTLLLPSKIERQANLFAAYMLIRESLIQEFAEFTVEQFSNCTGYPKELIRMRLK